MKQTHIHTLRQTPPFSQSAYTNRNVCNDYNIQKMRENEENSAVCLPIYNVCVCVLM